MPFHIGQHSGWAGGSFGNVARGVFDAEVKANMEKHRTSNYKIRWRLILLLLVVAIGGGLAVRYAVTYRDVDYSVSSLRCTVSSAGMKVVINDLTILDDKYDSYEVEIIARNLSGSELASISNVTDSRGPQNLTETVDYFAVAKDKCDIKVRGLSS